MLPAFALMLLAAAPIQKVEPIEKIERPKIDLQLPDMPKADGLKGPAKADEPMQAKQASGDLRSSQNPQVSGAKVLGVTHAKDFTQTKNGYKPVASIGSFTVGSLPAKTGAFKTCVKVGSSDGVPVSLRTSIKSPGGNDMGSSERVDVTFGTAESMDVVIDWPGFEASVAGEYKLVVLLDGKPAGEFPLVVATK
jgi:hypothetical protein